MRVSNKNFWSDFEGNPKPKTPFKQFLQCWRCNWGTRRPVTENQCLDWLCLASSALLRARNFLLSVSGVWGTTWLAPMHYFDDV